MTRTHSIPDRLNLLASSCAAMGSDFYASLAASAAVAYAGDRVLRDLLDAHEDAARIGLRLLGAGHFRALRGCAPDVAEHFSSTGGDGEAGPAWSALLDDLHENTAEYDRLLGEHIQTNEVARATPVLAGMLAAAAASGLPLRIFELGASAGLLLNFDRYRYEGRDWSWGERQSPLVLSNETLKGKPAHLDAKLKIVSRRGCDLHPLDVSKPQETDRLLSFVWPDQPERLDRLRAAIAIAREHPVSIDRDEGISWLPLVATPADGFMTVIAHTVVMEHFTSGQRAALRSAVNALAGHSTPRAPLGWLRMEQETQYVTRLTFWPGGASRTLAFSNGHAQQIEWLPAA